jgi:2-polyprenyl-6-methoxyphenol hydroxylase-like FAD-dependent oxidoreductase
VHHTHVFLARLVHLLRARLPDVLDAVVAAGGRVTAPPLPGGEADARPEDGELTVLLARRTTFEWALRRAVLAEPGIALRGGTGVVGLAGTRAAGGPPTVTGARLADGTTLPAGAVVVATGRRSALPAWLGDLGVEVDEDERPSGLVYLTRWYRHPATGGPAGTPELTLGNLDALSYLAVPGDGHTQAVTLAVRAADADLRARLGTDDGFHRACGLVPGLAPLVAPPARPLGPVRPMGGLVNRLRRFADADGRPRVAGVHAVGDAHTCTNPVYGRGCSLAVVQAAALADAVAAHPDDPVARATAYEAACAADVEPWFHLAVQTDALGTDPGAGGVAGDDVDRTAARGMEALTAASRTDPVLGRGFARLWNLLATPLDLAADPEFQSRAAAVFADPEAHRPPPAEGPTRAELLGDADASPAPAPPA